jgi:hypothetical protein
MTSVYRIRVSGRLSKRWADWFDGLTITVCQNGTTTLIGPVVDQAALHGLLATIRDLGLPVLSVTLLDLESSAIEGPENSEPKPDSGKK